MKLASNEEITAFLATQKNESSVATNLPNINTQVSRHSLDQRKLQALNNLKEIIKTGKIISVNLGLFQEKENKEVYTNFCGASVHRNGVILSASHCFEEVDLKTGKIGLDQLGNSLQKPHIIDLFKHSLIRAGDITIIYPQSEEGRQSALKLVQEMYLANQELQTNSILAMVTKMGSSNGSFGHSRPLS